MNSYGDVCLPRLSTILQLFCGCLLYWRRTHQNTTDMPLITDKLDHFIEYISQCAIIKLSLSGDSHWLHR
jgi:hypothetical protein